jgi:hypothetical protein
MVCSVSYVGVRLEFGVGATVDVRADILAHKFDKIECCRQSWMYGIDPSFLLIVTVRAAFRQRKSPYIIIHVKRASAGGSL